MSAVVTAVFIKFSGRLTDISVSYFIMHEPEAKIQEIVLKRQEDVVEL